MMNHDHQAAIDAFVRCARESEHCSSACAAETDAYLRTECIRLTRDCGEICWTAAAYLLHDSRFAEHICQLCSEVCAACAAECEHFSDEHCRHCAAACLVCVEECGRVPSAMTVSAKE